MAQLLWNVSSAQARLGLRIFFNLMLLILGFVGDQCCSKKVQLRLLQQRPLDIAYLTGWLRGTTAARAMCLMRRSPAGWMGYLMILAGLFWLVADLVVSGLVVTVDVVDRCPFNVTGDYEVMTSDHSIGFVTPWTTGSLWDLTTRAQATSQSNGGLGGIYHKVNGDPLFRADAQDIFGQWTCEVNGQDVSYPASQSSDSIISDLQSQGILYPENTYVAQCVDNVGNRDLHLTGWTSSVPVNTQIAWDVRATVEVTLNAGQGRVMRNFYCTMNAPDVDFVLAVTQPAALKDYCTFLEGRLFKFPTDGVAPVADPGLVIAATLDVMVMMAGAYQLGHNEPPPPIADATQGCMAPKALIPGPVIMIFVLVTMSTAATLGYWLCLTLNLHNLKRLYPGTWNAISKKTPNGLIDWMRQAAQETRSGHTTSFSHFKEWLLVISPHEDNLRLVRRESRPDEDPNTVHMIDPSQHAQSRNGYLPAFNEAVDVDTLQDPKHSSTEIAHTSVDTNRQSTYVKRKPLSTSR